MAANCCVVPTRTSAGLGVTVIEVSTWEAATSRVIGAVSTRAPLVPDTVTVVVTVGAVGLTVNVKTLDVEPDMDEGANAAVTPVGKPDTVKLTFPAKPSTVFRVTRPAAVLP